MASYRRPVHCLPSFLFFRLFMPSHFGFDCVEISTTLYNYTYLTHHPMKHHRFRVHSSIRPDIGRTSNA